MRLRLLRTRVGKEIARFTGDNDYPMTYHIVDTSAYRGAGRPEANQWGKERLWGGDPQRVADWARRRAIDNWQEAISIENEVASKE